MIRIWYDTQLDNHTCDPELGFWEPHPDYTASYVFGLEQPHYPVPAIVYEVHVIDWLVLITHKTVSLELVGYVDLCIVRE